MSPGGETVGEIKYVASIDTSQLAKDASKADKTVRDATSGANNGAKEATASLTGMARSLALVTGGFLSLRGATNFLKGAVADANQYQASINGLASVAKAFGQDTTAVAQAAQQLSADGLIPATQSAQAFKNALSSGFSLEEATMLLRGLKDQAVNNRQSFYDLGGAVVATTEGIRNGNSVLADATGTTKNLSVMAKEAGIGIDQMGSISQNAGYRTAVLNGFLVDASRSMGDAARYSETAAGKQMQLSVAMYNLRVEVGQVANALSTSAVGSLTNFISTNQQAIISIGSGVVAFAAVAGAMWGASKAIGGISKMMDLLGTKMAFATFGVSLLAGALASVAVGEITRQMEEAGNASQDTKNNILPIAPAIAGSTKEAEKLAKQLRKIDEEAQKARESFQEQLAELVADKRKSMASLTAQLEEEKAQYDKAYNDRLFDYNQAQAQEEQSHYEKTQKLQAQIDFLSRYNNAANQRRLSELQFTLARENQAYNKDTADKKAKFDQDAAAEKASYEKRAAEIQARLAAETALLEKHRADVDAIRNVILLDEIDKLKRSRDEQLKSLAEQRADAQSTATSIGGSVGKAFAGMEQDFAKSLENMKGSLGSFKIDWGLVWNSMVESAKSLMNNVFDSLKQGIISMFGGGKQHELQKLLDRSKNPNISPQERAAIALDMQKIMGRASGGPVSSGTPYLVGENPDGSINRTTEMFVPKQNGTILSSNELQSMLNGGSQTMNVTVNMNGVMTSTPADERAIAMRLAEKINQVMTAKGYNAVRRTV